MAVNNGTILARAWLEGTNDYQQRISDPTQSGITATIEDLFAPMNKMFYNQFQDYLVNRIAKTVAHGKVFNNPLAVFKKEKIDYGSSIQNVAFKWLEAHAYVDDDESLLKMARPEGVAWYVSQNRRDRYDLSITRQELYAATNAEYGLNNLINKMLELPTNSDNYDEMQIMINLLAIYETHWGFFKRKLSAAPTDEETGKEFLTQVMADSGMMKFPSTTFNAEELGGNIPTFVTDDEMVLIVTPQTNASIKVNTYSGLFNMDEAKAQARIVQVPFIPIPNAVAILTTRDIFDCHDTVFETDTFWNPQTLTNQYFLHHWGIYGVNPWVPAVLYTTDDASVLDDIQMQLSNLSLRPSASTVHLGGTVELNPTVVGTVSPDGENANVNPVNPTVVGTVSPDGENANVNPDGSIRVRPESCTWAITLGESSDENSALNSRTYVDSYGVLHVQKTGLTSEDVLTIHAKSTYFNPTSNTTSSISAQTTVTIS